MPAVNNYIIGLGGTGGETLAAFRRATVLRHPEFEQLQNNGTRFEYLYIDSNTGDIEKASRDDSEKWQVPGGKISLSDSERVCIDGAGFTKEGAQVHPSIAPWFGTMDNVSDNVFGGTAITGAGQRRRYGRMLFARKADEINRKLTQGITALRLGSTDREKITFHIFATLGGGTGSGSLIDTITLVHKLMPAGCEAEVLLYLFVGGDDPNVRLADVGYLYQNEYSALRDLNALMSGRWHPVMAGSMRAEEYHGGNPVKAVYLSSETSSLALDLEKQIEYTANACFDIISILRSGVQGTAERALTGEDIHPAAKGECCDPNNPDAVIQVLPSPKLHDDKPERSYHFQTVGVSRCKEPVMEIRTILKEEFAAQVNDRWLNGSLDKRDSRICSAEARENSDIYDGTAVLPGSRLSTRCDQYDKEKLDAFDESFNEENVEFTPNTLKDINAYVLETVRTIMKETRNELATYMGEIPEWQKLCDAEAKDVLAKIKQKLEKRRRWGGTHAAGVPIWGVANISTYLHSLIARLAKANPEVDFPMTLGNMEKRVKEWLKICGLTELLSTKSADMFELHLEEARAIICRALNIRRQAMGFFVEKCMISPAENLCQLIDKSTAEIQQEINSRCKNAQEQTRRIHGVMADVQLVYDENRLLKHTNYLHSADAESELARSLATFEHRRTTNDALEVGYPMPGLDDLRADFPTYWTESMRIHDGMVMTKPNDYQPAFHASIYEALADLQRSKPKEYQTKLHNLCENVDPLASIADAPLGGPGLQHLEYPPPVKAVLVGLPDAPPQTETDKASVSNFIEREMRGKASAANRYRAYPHQDKHEVRILYCQYWMPVRFFSFCTYLQEQMDAVLNSGSEDAKLTTLYYTNIDDKYSEKPALIPMGLNAAQRDIRRLFELSCYLSIPQSEGAPIMLAEKKDKKAPEPRLQLLNKDAVVRGMRIMDGYNSNQLESCSGAFAQHVRENVNVWMQNYGKDQADAVRKHLTCEVERLNASDRDEDKASARRVFALLNEFDERLARA